MTLEPDGRLAREALTPDPSLATELGLPDAGQPEPAKRQHHGVTFAVLALACASFSLLQSVIAPALPTIQQEVGASSSAASWLFTGYLLSASVFTPIVGRLGDMFGKERTLLAALCVLSLGCLLAALADSIGLLIFARVVQGAGGAIFPLSFGIIRDEFPPQRSAQGIAMISSILAIGGGIGIVLTGPIISTLSYHWLFWLPLFAVLIATVATVFFVPESPLRSPGRVDWLGALLLSAWLVLLLLGINQASHWGWGDPRIAAMLTAAIIAAGAWIRVEERLPEPLVDMRMMRIRGVWTVNAAAFLIGAAMFSTFVLIPEFAQTSPSLGYGFGASVTEGGLFLLPNTVAMMVVSPIGGWLAGRVGSRLVLIAGCLLSSAGFALLGLAHSEQLEVYAASALMGVGMGLAFASLAVLIVDAVPPHQTAVATGMNNVMRTLGGSVGSQVGASILVGSAVATNLPSERGFTLAFLFAAGAALLAALASQAVPRRQRP